MNQGWVRVRRLRSQGGLTLVELMIAMTLSLLVLAASTAMFAATAGSYRSEEDIAYVQDSGRFAIELLTRILRQTQYENWDPASGDLINAAAYSAVHGAPMSPALAGANNVKVSASETDSIGESGSGGINGSDSIRIRYFGVGKPGDASSPDGTVVDCAGNSVAGVTSIENADNERGTSIFYVGLDTTGEPNLYCKYKGSKKFTREPLIKGVESFQILYGLDTGVPDSYPDKFVPAHSILSEAEWRRVVAVRIALLVRGKSAAPKAGGAEVYPLFGGLYNSKDDPGTVINTADIARGVQGNFRKMFTTTVFLRNVVND